MSMSHREAHDLPARPAMSEKQAVEAFESIEDGLGKAEVQVDCVYV